MASMSYFATVKRSACDRCRKQKLRCPPQFGHDAGQPCARCARAGVPCVTGYTKPRGQSAKTVGDARPRQRSSPRPSIAQLDATVACAPQSSPEPAIVDLDLTAEEASAPLWFLDDDNCLFPPTSNSHDTETHVQRNGGEDISVLPNVCRQFLSEEFDDQDGYTELAPTALPSPRRASSNTANEAYRICRSRRDSDCSPIWGGLQGTECDLRLSQLNLDLCRQLSRQTKSALEIKPPASEGVLGPLTSDAFGDALNSTEEYLVILQDLGGVSSSSASSSSGGSPTAVSDGGTMVPPNLVCTLNLESCYFRIINLFNVLLSDLHKQLEKSAQDSELPALLTFTPPPARDRLPVLPGLRLAGFLVRQAGLQTKILFQAIQHQFEMIERLLGLPAELRVSGREDICSHRMLCDGWVTACAVPGGRNSGGPEKVPDESIQLLRERIASTLQIFGYH